MSSIVTWLKRHRVFRLSLLSTVLLFIVCVCAASHRGVPATEGIYNFGKVNDGLYRGAQPDEAGIQSLKRLGVKTIINLRMSDDVWRNEGSQAGANGILYTNAPMKGLGRPTDEQVKNILSLIETLPGPVYVHCQHGCDRTGTIIACYRIQHDQWQNRKALDEAEHYGMSAFERGMKKFVKEFRRSSVAVKK
jgi:tyrosine-protein phosphatase SIW14